MFVFLIGTSQDTVDVKVKKAKHYNLVKLGGAVQAYLIRGYDYEYYYGYENNGRNYYYDGANYQLYVGYEHIWEFKNKTAVALEPVIGASFFPNTTQAFIGNNAKFYWTNLDTWRMGIAIFMGYTYANHPTKRPISQDNGNYHQVVEINMNYHLFSTNVAIIPFQFRFKNVPLVVEGQFGLVGIGVLKELSEKYYSTDNTEYRVNTSNAIPYFLRSEIKIGFVLP